MAKAKLKKSSPVKSKARPGYPGTFDFFRKGKEIATVTVHEDGLIEFGSKQIEVSIECIGTKDEQVLVQLPNSAALILKPM